MLYGKEYGGADPVLIGGDVFRMIISVPEFGEDPAKRIEIVQPGAESRAESGAEEILTLLGTAPLSKSEMARNLN